jgi:hypothetical protein
MIRAITLVDLDDTLFQTIRKCPPDLPAEALTPLGFARDGSALSYATPRQMRFIELLGQTSHLVPVTARSLDALRRVRIPFTAAICAHGGVVLDQAGQEDSVWASRIAAEAAAHADELVRLVDVIAACGDSAIQVRVLTEGAVPLYVLVKHAEQDADALHRLVDAAVPALPAGWTHHRNGNNIALMPPYLGKAKAVAHILPALRARFPDTPVIGIGDSITDAPFMALCDFAMLPTGSQLATRMLP